MKIPKDLLAFVHIKKAAGTTLNHILRINFFLRHCEVKRFYNGSGQAFSAADMIQLLKINPFVASISGHEVKPHGDIMNLIPSIRFITLLRDPVKRYLSQYQYNYEFLGESMSFDDYLNMDSSVNKQTRTIAGDDDIEAAKEILTQRFFLVGIVEEFDEFLILLKRKMKNKNFRLGYRKQNRANNNSYLRLSLNEQYQKYKERIIENNFLDIELYRYIKEKILPVEKKEYGDAFEIDLAHFKQSNKNFPKGLLRYLDYGYRRLYYQPVTMYRIKRVNQVKVRIA